MILQDKYIMSDKINKIDNYIESKFNNICINYKGDKYCTGIEIYGNSISNDGLIVYYGKFLVSKNGKHVPRNIRSKISKIYSSRVKNKCRNYIMSIDSKFDFVITYKEKSM